MKNVITTLLALTLTIGAIAQNDNQTLRRTINVTGNAQMEVTPDEIYVQVELREYDKKGNGKIDIDFIKSSFIKAVTSVGISDTNITVQSFQGWDENYWWYKKNRKNPDLKASITYLVKLPNTKKMDQLVEKLDDEATQNFFIAKVAHSKEKEFKKQMKIEAVKNAKEKAVYLSAAIGEEIGAAITINEPGEMHIYQPMAYQSRMTKLSTMSDTEAPSTPNIDFKKIKYQYEVHTVFSLK